jgi:aquaporin Z
VIVAESVLTAMFLLVILGSTDKKAPAGFAPLAIGLCLTLIHLISIPVSNTSVNPARSLGVGVYVGDWAMMQMWVFWLAPLVGALAGALIYKTISTEEE